MIKIAVSVGELIDKLSILQVKKNNVTNHEKLHYINNEFELLFAEAGEFLKNETINVLYQKLIKINSALWSVEDKIRERELKKKFDDKFVFLARKVYKTNDKRFSVKNKINELTNSQIKEVKNYKKYK